MSHYKSNLRDIEFNLFEVLGRDEILGQGPFADVDGETARSILSEVDRLAREDLAASYEDSDRNPPVFDPATGEAPIPESFKKSYQAWMDAEYWRLGIAEELGGTPAPSTINWAIFWSRSLPLRCTTPANAGPAPYIQIGALAPSTSSPIAQLMVDGAGVPPSSSLVPRRQYSASIHAW